MIKLPEGLRIGVYSREKLMALWYKLRQYDSLFADDDTRDPEVFANQVLALDTLVLEADNGIIILRKIREGLRGEVHLSFWDHKLSARRQLFQDALVWAFINYDLYRIETFVADYARAVRRFLENRMNFKHEGVMRHRVWHQGRLLDMHVYSILREEVLNGV